MANSSSLRCLLCSGITAVGSIAVAAPCEAVWEVVCDLDATPAYLTAVELLERTDGPKFGVGTRWREKRVEAEGIFVVDKTITSISNKEPYSVQIGVTFEEMGCLIRGGVNTATLEMCSMKGDDGQQSCHLMCTFAFTPSNWLTKIYWACCAHCGYLKMAQRGVDSTLEDINSEVLRREMLKS